METAPKNGFVSCASGCGIIRIKSEWHPQTGCKHSKKPGPTKKMTLLTSDYTIRMLMMGAILEGLACLGEIG
jgi:hypothetical protein